MMIKPHLQTRWSSLLHIGFSTFVVLSSCWLCLAIWIQAPLGALGSKVLIGIWIAFALTVLGIYASHLVSRKKDVMLYILSFLLALFWYLSLQPQQDRDWNPEVAQLLSSEKNGDLITLNNVRNFQWQTDGSYRENWETRHFNLNDIEGVNILGSYWMGPQIAHTLISFDFKGQAPLVFSLEIRKEQHEDFSAIGGFFRKYELSLVAADEKDIVYTRTHVRGEQVYIFPIQMPKAQMQALFLEYLHKAEQLAQQPKWYNTLTSNCTTLVFDMVQAVSKQQLPSDYRLLVSGYLPNYLYDLKVINQEIDLKSWYQIAHLNPKVTPQPISSSAEYSRLVRQGLP